ncbi:uncharacterized protein EDB91DRAFT_1352708 [Suillus paluster]|uniref:uncharacterized protein n=1 Tax=Suillus paluster TaxID=48578 RepID=UPI001B88722C|nr:uncharacterized protein EDB91DRAFT_1352708 [Suillus paluster]KAG1717834.1 hypothetical protein EDB91DRAFT_1352708 [Suillus paluster]
MCRKSGYWEVCVRSVQTSVSRSVSRLCQRYPRVTGGVPPATLSVCPPPPLVASYLYLNHGRHIIQSRPLIAQYSRHTVAHDDHWSGC